MSLTPLMWEGTWDELAAHADEFAGRRLRLMILPPAPGPTDPRLRVLQEIETRSQMMNPGADTQNFLREGRSGGMFNSSQDE